MRPVPALLAASLSLGAMAQVPATIARDGCLDSLVAGGEHYDFSGGGSGRSAGLDYLRCTDRAWGYLLGASTYSIAGSRWTVGRAGATLRLPAGHFAYATATAGAGDNASGRFDYRKLSDGITFKANDRVFAKLEHEYFDIDRNRGNVLKAGAIVIAFPAVSLDVTAARSIDGKLPTRSITARSDWVTSAVRAFAGMAYGRLVPQVENVATGERVPDVISRQAFGGVALRLPVGELIAAFDTTRTGASRRNTYTLALQVPLP